jgi:hypothetical protein
VKPQTWLAVLLMVVGGVMLVVDGAAALWFAVIAVGMALATIDDLRTHHT